uniref:Zinc finger CCCH domain-containing protein 32 n=2 Tax=Macrostomum lignano TaxID=282301 RepID=A0A1I8I0K7_9PLAT
TLVARAKLRLRKKRIYCVFYCRFGHCRRANNCIYLHDPNMVAICKRFLKRGGACDAGPNCRLSHCLDPAKLPSCEFYDTPAGCNRPACPYRHVRYPAGTPVCPDFRLLGHCRRGVQCPLKHLWTKEAGRSEKVDEAPSTKPSELSNSQRGDEAELEKDASYIPVPRYIEEDSEGDEFDETVDAE